MKKYLLIILSLVLLNVQCKKVQYGSPAGGLPNATQTGANTFGAYVDGVLFVPKGPTIQIVGRPPLTVYYNFTSVTGNYLSLYAIDYIKGPSIDFLSNAPLKQGQTYQLQNAITQIVKADYFYSGKNHDVTAPLTGQLTITRLDSIRRIISGTFAFDAINNGTTIHVTQGRFDLKF